MIKEPHDLPPNIVGFDASGKLDASDYRGVVLPALGLKVGIEHLRAWKRIAVVTDIHWVSHLTDLFGWMTPGETKTFTLEERDEAVAGWRAEGTS